MRFMPTTSVFDHDLARKKYKNLNTSKYSNRKIYHARGVDKSNKNTLEFLDKNKLWLEIKMFQINNNLKSLTKDEINQYKKYGYITGIPVLSENLVKI